MISLISCSRYDFDGGTAEVKAEAIRTLHELSGGHSKWANTSAYNRNTIVKEKSISPLIALVCEEEGITRVIRII